MKTWLSVICRTFDYFFGGIPGRLIRFKHPGEMHCARCMSKVTCSLKIFIFKSQFKLTKKVERGLRDFRIFIVKVCFKARITTILTKTSSYNYFKLNNSLLEYSRIHEEIEFKVYVVFFRRSCWTVPFWEPRICSNKKKRC